MTAMASSVKTRSLFDAAIVRQAIVDSFRKLTPRRQVRNPVMFVVYVGSILTTLLWAQAAVGQGEAPAWFIFWVSVWLWFTVLFANFAEAMAEGRGKAQAASLRKSAARPAGQAAGPARARRALRPGVGRRTPAAATSCSWRRATSFPADGEVVEGVASVDESAITGESAPVIRESGGDRSSVTGGTQVLSDWLIVEVTANPGRDVPRPHDRAGRGRQAAEDAQRDRARHPAGRADDHLPARDRHAAAVLALRVGVGRAGDAGHGHRAGGAAGVPDPHHHRRAALRHRHRRHGPDDPEERHRHVGPRGRGGRRRGRAAARQDRHDHARQPPGDRSSSRRPASRERDWPTRPSWPRSPTRRPEGRSIVVLAKEKYEIRGARRARSSAPPSCPSRPRPA